MIKNLFAVWIYVKDLVESRNFYEKLIGFKFKFQDQDWVEYDLGQTTFALLQRPKSKGPVKPQKTHIMFQVVNIEACQQQLIDNKVKIIGSLRVEPYGKLLTFEDPNGHWLELFEPTKCGCCNHSSSVK